MLTGSVFNIKRLAVHDGDGIRTTVFFKGCPLKCAWCHNPEGIAFERQLAYYAHKCQHCGRCALVCPANTYNNGAHDFNRSACMLCGKCEDACFNNAFELFGRQMTSDALLEALLEDRIFYEESGGGVTLSGGECLAQADFCAELLEKCKARGLNTAIDTCGYASKGALDSVMPYTDTFLYDLKAMDEAVHVCLTGRSNDIILENLRYLYDRGCKIEIRVPFVPGLNADQIEKIGAFLRGFPKIVKVRALAYHNYAGSKYAALGMPNTLPERVPTARELSYAQSKLSN